MVLDNLEVYHKSFGKGVVSAFQGKYMTVQFDNISKTFVYPDAFEKFFTLADGTVSEEIMADIAASKNRKQAILEKKKQENLLAMTKGIVIPGKEGALSELENEEENRYKNQQSEEV
jgi:hypothetical protein